ncbi:MAG: PEP-CTERM sorting domain-containing protein [Alteromonadaceae bacterium]|jgi:hypothetical protein
MKKIIFPAAILALIANGFSYAGLMEVVSNDSCNLSSVQITDITAVAPPGSNIVTQGDIDATSCLGFITSPDNDWGNEPNPNIGALYDGLLNEEASNTKNGYSYYVPGNTFLTNINDSMIDLNGDGDATDPGWIRLGGMEVGNGFIYESVKDYNLDGVIDISFNLNGTWSLTVDPSAIEFATSVLGRPSVFDHLAFVMKGPNNVDGSWAIYDFNFHDLIDDYGVNGLDISLGDTAYAFEGTWDKNLFVNDDALSHMSVWAHDPPAVSDVPEPSTFTIFALGLIGLLLRKTSKN